MCVLSRPLARRVAILTLLVALFAWMSTAQAAVRLGIGSASGATGETVDVPVLLSGGAMASTILFNIHYDSQLLQFISLEDGSTLTAQQYTYLPGLEFNRIPVAVVGGATYIRDGELCVVSFRILSELSTVTTLTIGTASAASPANLPIPVVPSPGEIFLNCEGFGPNTPTGVSASTENAAGVLVLWDAAAGAAEYRVYRAPVSDAEAIEAVSDWIAGVTSWLDTTAAAVQAPALGCQGGVAAPIAYYYWVRARDEGGCPSEYSEPAEGSRGLASGKVSVVSSGAPAIVALLMMLASAAARRRKRTDAG